VKTSRKKRPNPDFEDAARQTEGIAEDRQPGKEEGPDAVPSIETPSLLFFYSR